MFVTPAYAQTSTGATPDVLISVLPFLLIFVVMYFLMIRPQRQQMKQREQMLGAIRRGDSVVLGGGIVGKVTKVADNDIEVEIAQGVKVNAVRSMIAEVRVKGEPAANSNAKN
jgi:preprotein translocase subunit YajC